MPSKKPIRSGSGRVEASKVEAPGFELDGIPETSEGKPETPEVASPEGRTRESSSREGEREAAAEPQTSAPAPTSVPVPAQKDTLTQKIESVLEEDLGEVYKSMPPEKQAEFQKKGEEVAGKIRTMIETAKFSFRKALGLIRDWLKMIPGVNKFFLEQEAKIKADKISHIAKGG